jgi:hypothetical protein
MQKARSHPHPTRKLDQAPTACMHTVSGSISLAVRRSFHLSLTVLCTIGHRLVFSLGGWSPQIQPGFLVSRPTRVLHQNRTRISPTGLSPPMVGLSRPFDYPFQSLPWSPTTPKHVSIPRFGLFPLRSPLLRESHVDFSSSGYLDVSVPRVGSAFAVTGSLQPGFPIRTSPDQSPLAAPRSFSQLATSFIAGLCLGIHTCALIRLTNSIPTLPVSQIGISSQNPTANPPKKARRKVRFM